MGDMGMCWLHSYISGGGGLQWASGTPGSKGMNTASTLSLALHPLFLKLAPFSQNGILNSGENLAIGSSQAHISQSSHQRGDASLSS